MERLKGYLSFMSTFLLQFAFNIGKDLKAINVKNDHEVMLSTIFIKQYSLKRILNTNAMIG